MSAALWITMSLHVGAFMFWLVASAVTMSHLQDREKELEEMYGKAIANANRLAHEANQQFIKQMYKGGDDGQRA